MSGAKSTVRKVNKGDLIEVGESLRALLLSSEGKDLDLTTLKLKESKQGYFLVIKDWKQPLCMLVASPGAKFPDIQTEINKVHPNGSGEYVYSYIDRDNEIVRITSDAELNEAFSACVFDSFLVINLSESKMYVNNNNYDNNWELPKVLLDQICSICRWSLPGTAFVCLQCKDFIVCESCELRCYLNSIHPAHIFAKVRNDLQLQSLKDITPIPLGGTNNLTQRSTNPLTISKVVEMTLSLFDEQSKFDSIPIEEENRDEDVNIVSDFQGEEEVEIAKDSKDESDNLILLEMEENERNLQYLRNMGIDVPTWVYRDFNGDMESIIEALCNSPIDSRMSYDYDSDDSF